MAINEALGCADEFNRGTFICSNLPTLTATPVDHVTVHLVPNLWDGTPFAVVWYADEVTGGLLIHELNRLLMVRFYDLLI